MRIPAAHLPTSECYDPVIHQDYCGLGHPQYLQIFKVPASVAWHQPIPDCITADSIMAVLEEAYKKHCHVIETYLMNGYGHEGIAELEGGADQIPWRVMSGLKEFELKRNEGLMVERHGLLYLKGRLIKIWGPRPGVIWTPLEDILMSDEEMPAMVDKDTVEYTILSEVALGLPDHDNREWESSTLHDAWGFELERCKERTAAYLSGLRAGEEVRGNA